ncbi:hypothetical protein QFZ72_005045 [Bacillus sp. V2I10]|nr:hypothetical protein [Bacillus sp. V2I10]
MYLKDKVNETALKAEDPNIIMESAYIEKIVQNNQIAIFYLTERLTIPYIQAPNKRASADEQNPASLMPFVTSIDNRPCCTASFRYEDQAFFPDFHQDR